MKELSTHKILTNIIARSLKYLYVYSRFFKGTILVKTLIFAHHKVKQNLEIILSSKY